MSSSEHLRRRILWAVTSGLTLLGCAEDPDPVADAGTTGGAGGMPMGGVGGTPGGTGGDIGGGVGGAGNEGGVGGMPMGGEPVGGEPVGGEPIGGEPVGGTPGPDPRWPSLPDPDDLSCPPDDGEGFESGPCCEQIFCHDLPDEGQCPEPTDDNRWELASQVTERGFGSGECLCGDAITGPYQPTDAGRCCYVVSIQWCTGRPFYVDDQVQQAASMPRSDWL
ncbi:MAG: hypothetical protein ACE366_19895 [Bradymonadia bacterium]